MAGLFDVEQNEDKKYSKWAGRPQYKPTMDKPPMVAELYNNEKTNKFIQHIREEKEAGHITEDEAEYLRLAAYRHVRFRYDLAAEYFVWASPAMQRLMEESALVIVDINDAIANGYVALSDKIKKIVEENNEK